MTNMHLYFFDLDDTITNTRKIVMEILQNNKTPEVSYHKFNKWMEEKINEYGVDNIPLLDNAIVSLLRKLLLEQPENVYYITARSSSVRKDTILWLKHHKLWINDEQLIMDTEGVKGFTISKILGNSPKEFAFLFDDLKANHVEASKYSNIISCLPF